MTVMTSREYREYLKKKEREQQTGKSQLQNRIITASEYRKYLKANNAYPAEEEKDTWFQKGAFSDGYQFGDITKSVYATGKDVGQDISTGIYGIGEKVVDAGATIVGGIGGLFGADDFKNDMKEFVAKDLYDEEALGKKFNLFALTTSTAKAIPIGPKYEDPIEKLLLGNKSEEDLSVLGEKSDALVQSAGQLGATIGLQALGVPWWLTTGVTSFGSETENAFNQGASYGEAIVSGLISAGLEVGLEKLSGGISFGGKTLTDGLQDALSKSISNKVAKTLAQYGVDLVGEGMEESLTEVGNAIGRKLTYEDEKTWNEILKSEEALESYLDAFIGGMALSGFANVGKAVKSTKTGRDYNSGLSSNEQKVVDKEVENRIAEMEKSGQTVDKKTRAEIEKDVKEDLQKGFISIDTIERTLGRKTYDSLQSLSKEMEEYNSLNKMKAMEMTGEQSDRLAELKEKNKNASYESEVARLKEQLSTEVSDATMKGKDTYLQESYNERGRRSQAFESDVAQYKSEAAKKTVQNAVGKMNNTRRAHEFVERLAKISEDKGIVFDFTDSKKISELGYGVEGKTVNGYIQGENVTLNLNSAQALNKVVGHEITHFLEGTEHYDALQQAMEEYVNLKGEGEYNKRLAELTERYKDVKDADAKKELLADLVGEYLFMDEKFVRHLSTKNRNLFQKIYDEIKYLVKTFTGTKEGKQLEKVKKIFEETYKEDNQIAGEWTKNIKYSLNENAKSELHKALYDKSYRQDVLLRDESPAIMLSQKGVKNLPMVMKASHIRENVFTEEEAKQLGLKIDKHTHYHGLGEEFFLKVIDGLDDVDLAYRGTKTATDSSRRENYFLLISKLKDQNGNTVNVPVYINEYAQYNRVFVDVNKISTVFGRDNFETYINNQIKNKNLVRIKNRSNQSSERNALIAKGYREDAPIDSISQNQQNTTQNPKKSLSDNAIAPELAGSWNVQGKDIALEEAIGEQVAPVQQEYTASEESEKQVTEEKQSDGKTTKFSRKDYHNGIIENLKEKFKEKGFDFDSVLSKAKDKSTFASVDNTPQRFMEKTLGYKEGQILSDLTVNQVAQNESEAIRWLNSYTDRKNGFLAQISKQYGIKPRSKESAAAQMYGEGFYVNEAGDYVKYGDEELAKDFPDPEVQKNIKGLAKDPRIRQIYDDTLNQINESRVRNGYPEIPRRKDYFLHFHAMEDTFSRLGIPFNPNDIKAKDLPTDINGVTADLKPGQPYFASAQQRKGNRTTYDLLGGLERYLGSAKNQIYHIDDIQTLRALRNYIADTYGQAKGLESLNDLSEEEAAQRIEQVYNSHLSTFAKFLNEEANVLAGKTSLIDRGLEGVIGRKGITFLDTVNKQVGSNMVGMNVSSSLTNLVSVVQGFAKANKFDFAKAFTQTVSNKISEIAGNPLDDFTEQNPLIVRRKGAERFTRTPYEVIRDSGYVLAGAIDNFSTELITRAKYNELTRKGMDSYKAHIEADKWASRILGDRSYGQQPQLYNSKMLGLVTKFQLEVRNQLDSMYYDTIQEAKVSNEEIQDSLDRNSKVAAKVASTFTQLAIGQHIFGQVFESIAGYNPTFDIIEVLMTLFGFDDEEDSEDTALDNLEQGFLALMEDLPYSSLVLNGGRIPISSALPIGEFISGQDQYGNEKSRVQTVAEALPYYLLPTGWGQTKKTIQGVKMYDDNLPVAGSYTNNDVFDFLNPNAKDKEKKLRFTAEESALGIAQAAVFGQYANKNAREYFDEGRTPLNEKKTQELVDLDIPISEYWTIQDKLKGKDKLAEKGDVIANLDLPIAKKNLLINNAANRKEPIDLTDYDLYSDFEEFDFATKNPGKYLVSKVTGGYKKYNTYMKALNGIEADRNQNGQSISGSRKKKVIEYINGLDASYEEKILLLKSQYPSDDRYNNQIVNYIDESGLSYEEKIALLRELGFTVTSDGKVRW